MRRLLICLLIFITVLSAGPVRTRQAQANPALLLAPEAAVGMLELTMMAAAGAAAVGVISTAQNQEYQNELQALVDRIQHAVGSAIHESIEEAVKLADTVNRALHPTRTCDKSEQRRSGVDRRATPRTTPDRRARIETNCSNFEDCCGGFRKRIGSFGDYRHQAFRVFKNEKHSKLKCCFEFDHVHHGLEIFDENGRHLGERSCDDRNTDPCEWTRALGQHAAPSTSNHSASKGRCAP